MDITKAYFRPKFRQWNDEEINYLCNSGPVYMFKFSGFSVKNKT